jgi:hypothetical protein
MSQYSLEPCQYKDLPTETSFRVIEHLPGKEGNPVSCLLHIVDWSDLMEYEAILLQDTGGSKIVVGY